MAFDAFMKIDGIPGESTDDKHKDWIELLKIHHGLIQLASTTASNAGGATAERVQHKDLVVSHLLDKATPKLMEACCTGKHFKEVIIELCRAGGDKQKYLEIKLEQVIVSTIDLDGGNSDFPHATLSLNYGKIKWTYTHQKRSDGTGGGNVSGGWDLTTNKVAA